MNNSQYTFESVWAALQETNRILKESQAENDRLIKESARRQEETDRIIKESQAETAKQMKETDKIVAGVATLVKALGEQVGGWDKSHGMFAEEYFINSLNNGEKKFFGEQFEKLIANYSFNNSSTNKQGEFDIVLINCTSAAIIEVKFKARKNDVQQLLNQVSSFREEFPQYQSHRIYLGMAALTFEKDVDTECVKEGIAVFKQDGDTIVITDDNLKVF